MKFHHKQQYTILFQWNFISEVYLLQENIIQLFIPAKTFGGHCNLAEKNIHRVLVYIEMPE